MQTLSAKTFAAALVLATSFIVTGYAAKQVRPNGFVLVSSDGAILAIKIGV